MSIAVTSKKHNPRSKYRVTKHEKIELEIFNADLKRSYPHVDIDTPPLRSALVHRVAQMGGNRFRLCRDVMALTKAFHNPSTRRVATTINDAIKMLVKEQRKPVVHAAMAQAVAA